MTRDEIYDHLAQVYLGKKNMAKPKAVTTQFSAWLVLNMIITVIIFATSFYGLTAFLTHRIDKFQDRVIFSLSKGPIRIRYDLSYPYPPMKAFSLAVPNTSAEKYDHLEFSIRGAEGSPGMVRVEVRNERNETASVFIDGVSDGWSKKKIALDSFEGITDWSSVSEILFVLESWNTRAQKGLLLIDDLCFSSAVAS
jgi:hypothetical protein